MTKIMENKLNKVTGGDFWETALDSEALYFKGLMDEEFSSTELMFHWIKDSDKVDKGWAKAGITSVTSPFGSNKYFYNGKRISQKTAMRIIGVL